MPSTLLWTMIWTNKNMGLHDFGVRDQQNINPVFLPSLSGLSGARQTILLNVADMSVMPPPLPLPI